MASHYPVRSGAFRFRTASRSRLRTCFRLTMSWSLPCAAWAHLPAPSLGSTWLRVFSLLGAVSILFRPHHDIVRGRRRHRLAGYSTCRRPDAAPAHVERSGPHSPWRCPTRPGAQMRVSDPFNDTPDLSRKIASAPGAFEGGPDARLSRPRGRGSRIHAPPPTRSVPRRSVSRRHARGPRMRSASRSWPAIPRTACQRAAASRGPVRRPVAAGRDSHTRELPRG